jgi:hypothetical protein
MLCAVEAPISGIAPGSLLYAVDADLRPLTSDLCGPEALTSEVPMLRLPWL